MSKKLIEQHVECRLRGYTPPRLPRMWACEVDIEPVLSTIDRWASFRVKLTVGSNVQGPVEAADEIRKQIIRGIVHELYGDIHRQLWELYTLLHEETYRPTGSPVMEKLSAIMEDTRP